MPTTFNQKIVSFFALLLISLNSFAIHKNSDEDDSSKLCVRNGISNNGDGINDYFAIEGISKAENQNNEVHVYNRWGVEVFSVKGYNGDLKSITPNPTRVFRGISDGRATFNSDQRLPSGTYYYTLTIITSGGGEKSQAGFIYIN